MLRIGTLLVALVVAAPPALAQQAVRDCASNNHEQAIRACTQLIRRNPRHAVYYYNRAVSYVELGKVDLALADYNRAIELNPRYVEALNNRGRIYLRQGDNERALQDFNRAIQVNPRFAFAHNGRGEALELMSRLEEALAAYNRAIEINPRYARAYANRGDIWRKMGRREDAIADYRHALRLDARNAIALAGLKTLGVAPGSPAGTGSLEGPPRDPFARPSPVAAPPAAPPPRDKRASTGTGFFVSPRGHVLTNHHVVENCGTITVALEGNVTAVAGLGDDTTMIQMSAPVQPGNSGGPVFDQYGNVVAVVVSKLNALRIAKVTSDIPQNVNFAIKSPIALGFMEAGNVSASTAASTTKLEGTQIAERARAFTTQIRCN